MNIFRIKYWTFLVALILVFTMVLGSTPSVSAVTVTGVSGVEVTCDSNGSISESSGTVTIKAAGSFTTRKTTVITITNTSDSTATISFDVSTSNIDSDVSTIDDLGGKFNQNLTARQSVTYKLCSTRFSANNTGVATLSNFSVTVASTKYDVGLSYDTDNGSVTIDGAAATPGTYQIASATFKANANSGASFLGWINPSTGEVISTDSSYNVVATGTMNLEAVFAGSNKAWFYGSDKTYLFDNLTDANAHASSASSKTIVLANSGTLAAGDYTISAGVTLLIPRDSANTIEDDTPTVVTDYTQPTPFRTLTMQDGSNIIVNGTLCVAGQHSAKMNSYNGHPTGPQGYVVMKKGSTISVNSGGTLYAWGYIVGEKRSANTETPVGGTVTIKNGANVYECFQVTDYRGGTFTSEQVGNDNRVFPLSQYYVQNVQVPMTLEAGATETGYMSVDVTLVGIQSAPVPFIGSSGLFRINSGSITKDYDEQNDRLIVDINGNLTVSNMTIDIKVAMIGSVTMKSSEHVLPLTSNMTVNINSGYTVTLQQDMALLPGSAINIMESGNLTIDTGYNLYVYDADEWGGYCSEYDKTFIPVNYAYDRFSARAETSLVDAVLLVNGTLDSSNGYVYSTQSGGNIYSTQNGIFKNQIGSETVTYQAKQNSSELESWVEIPLTPAQLKHADGTYLKTAETGAGDYYYNKDHGKWVLGDHTITDEVTDPTCTEKGYTTHTCTCGESYTGNETDALGHDYEITESVAATCTEDGHITYTCKNDPTHTYTETLSHAGHSYEEVVTPPTCTAEGYTTYTCAACGDSYTDDTVAATGHNHIGKVTTEPTCTTEGVKTYTCSVCGDSYTEAITATGHTPGAAATCTTAQTCSVCGAELVAAGHKYEDNVCTDCHHAFNDSMQAFLKLENAVVMGVGFKLDAVTSETQGAALTGRVGLLIWDAATKLTKEEAVVGNNACQQLTNTTYNGERFEVLTDGIPAKNLGDAVAFRAYYKKTDNTYVYSRIIDSYSPKQYCYNKLAATDEESAALHPLMIAILNYCTAAQEYFASKPDIYGYTITERINSGLTDAQKTLKWDGSLVRSDWSVSKEGALTRNKTVVTSRGGNLTLKGAINYTYYFKTSLTNVKSAQILTWTEEKYNEADVLTEDNATVSKLEWVADNSRYEYVYAGLPAKDMFSPIYACAKFTDSDGNVYYSGVIAYCPERFSSINQSSSDSYLAALAKWIVIYGDAARTYFADK